MAVIVGAEQLKRTYPGVSNGLYFRTAIIPQKDANGSIISNKTYLTYQKPSTSTSPSDTRGQIPTDAKRDGSTFLVTAAELKDGKWVSIKQSDSFYVTNSNELKKYDGPLATQNDYVISNDARADLASTSPTGLGQQAKGNARENLIAFDGLTRNKANELIGITNPPASPDAPAAPEPPPPNSTTTGGGGESKINLSNFTVENNDPNFLKETSFKEFAYPLGTGNIGQDFLKIEIVKYNKSEANSSNTGLKAKTYSPVTEGGGVIRLGLQASITDQNSVLWSDDTINGLQLGAALNTLGIINGDQGFDDLANTAINTAKDPAIKALITTGMTKAALNTSDSNLFARVTNSIVNPNLELLFNRPNLRPFNFIFKMAPRDADEAEQVKGIIKALKQSSAVQIGSGELFLKTPFVYRLSYMTQKGQEEAKIHPSLNLIKECALTSVNVDYTPSNVYMTYNDDSATMTAYTMQLQFSELIPVYADDYLKEKSHLIGY